MAIPIADAGVDQFVLFAALPTSKVLNGNGTFFAPAAAIASWSWTLLEKPAGSAAALSSTVVQNPILNGIDKVGTYRLMLVVTDDTAQSSDSGLLSAPTTAFVNIMAMTEHLSLVVPAPGQRNTAGYTNIWPQYIDQIYGANQNHYFDTDDPHYTLAQALSGVRVSVTNVPTAPSQVLAMDSIAPYRASWQASGASIPISAIGTLGKIELADAPVDPLHPKAVTQDRVKWSAQINSKLARDSVGDPAMEFGLYNDNPLPPTSPFIVNWMSDGEFLEDIWFLLSSGGLAGATTTFRVYCGTLVQWLGSTLGGILMADISGPVNVAPAVSYEPLGISKALNFQTNPRDVISVIIENANVDCAAGLTMTMFGKKKW